MQKNIFMVEVLELPSSKTKIVMIYKLKLPHDNFSLSVGERSKNSKFSMHHQDQSMEILATREGEDEHIHTLEDR